MGCGGSTVFAEDGGVAPGKGETKIEWNPEAPVEVGFYYYTEKDAKILTKDFPMDKECVEKQFNEDHVVSSNGGMHWIKVVPGNRYAMKYTEGGHSVSFPGQVVLDLPKKIHAFQTKDDETKDKLVTDLKKDVEKEEGHAYNAEGADDKIKADIDAMATMCSTAEMAEEMKVFKKACMSVEDLQPWNTINAVSDISTEYGHWDEKEGKLDRVLGMADKVKMKAEEEAKKRGPQVAHKAMSTMQKGFKGVIEGAVKGGCKKAGPEAEELAPGLAARIDYGDSCVPGAPRVDERTAAPAAEGAEAEAKPEGEAAEGDADENAAKAEYEADKDNIDQLKNADGTSLKSQAESYLKTVYGSISATEAAADKDKAVIAITEGFQVPAFINEIEGDDAKVSFATNGYQDETEGKIPKEAATSSIDGTTATDAKVDAFTSLPEPNDEFLVRGRAVTVHKDRAFFQAWVKKVTGDEVEVEDQFKVAHKAAKGDVFTHMTQQQIAARGLALMPNFGKMKFWWVAGEDAEDAKVSRKVRVWRFGAPDTVQEYELSAVRAKAKPTETNKEPTHEVHTGFSADVDILLGAKYAYNFQIGDAFFVDFDKKVESDKGCKVITCNARVEY